MNFSPMVSVFLTNSCSRASRKPLASRVPLPCLFMLSLRETRFRTFTSPESTFIEEYMKSHGYWYIELNLERVVRGLVNFAACIAIGYGLAVMQHARW